MWLQDTGILDKIKGDGIRRANPCPQPKFWKDEPLNLYKLGIIMIVQVIGIATSAIVFLCELRKNKIKNSSNDKDKADNGIELRILEDKFRRRRNRKKIEEQSEIEEDAMVNLNKIVSPSSNGHEIKIPTPPLDGILVIPFPQSECDKSKTNAMLQ